MNTRELEERRLLALKKYGLLDTAPEEIFDEITVAIANICEAPIALFSLVDSDRQWFKSAHGLEARQTPRDVAFCDHAIMHADEMMVVADAIEDPRFCDNPLVTEDPRIRFYAGRPIVSSDGYAIGTLCVIDRKPRQLLPHQLAALNALGKTISGILEERQRMRRVALDRDDMEHTLNEHALRYQNLYGDAEAILTGLIDKDPTPTVLLNPTGTVLTANRAWFTVASQLGWQPSLAGENYVQHQIRNLAVSDSDELAIQNGIREILAGQKNRFTVELPTEKGVLTLEARPVAEPVAGAVLQHSFEMTF